VRIEAKGEKWHQSLVRLGEDRRIVFLKAFIGCVYSHETPGLIESVVTLMAGFDVSGAVICSIAGFALHSRPSL
jgi:hypothetical protein